MKQEVHRPGRTVHQTKTYDSTTGKIPAIGAKISTIQNYYACLVELDNDELRANLGVENFFLEIKSVGAGLGGGFTNTNKLKVMAFKEAVDEPDGESWKK